MLNTPDFNDENRDHEAEKMQVNDNGSAFNQKPNNQAKTGQGHIQNDKSNRSQGANSEFLELKYSQIDEVNSEYEVTQIDRPDHYHANFYQMSSEFSFGQPRQEMSQDEKTQSRQADSLYMNEDVSQVYQYGNEDMTQIGGGSQEEYEYSHNQQHFNEKGQNQLEDFTQSLDINLNKQDVTQYKGYDQKEQQYYCYNEQQQQQYQDSNYQSENFEQQDNLNPENLQYQYKNYQDQAEPSVQHQMQQNLKRRKIQDENKDSNRNADAQEFITLKPSFPLYNSSNEKRTNLVQNQQCNQKNSHFQQNQSSDSQQTLSENMFSQQQEFSIRDFCQKLIKKTGVNEQIESNQQRYDLNSTFINEKKQLIIGHKKCIGDYIEQLEQTKEEDEQVFMVLESLINQFHELYYLRDDDNPLLKKLLASNTAALPSTKDLNQSIFEKVGANQGTKRTLQFANKQAYRAQQQFDEIQEQDESQYDHQEYSNGLLDCQNKINDLSIDFEANKQKQHLYSNEQDYYIEEY
ncbi:UNKNOWN [Stylonychia lemnae]|uniref:Uncharacterized protein n=1 Tax=Stylonychia lemnae TaxID=5949 RepID=A0A078B0C5_STYLE|nr:UNKNOWN [Stylonychia lemnae]|eukprot:CDW87959.1 UNKNOWN [Stylonychia lemnae]